MSGGERSLYMAIAAVVGLGLLALWLSGAVSAALFGSGWTPITLSDLAETTLRFPSHLSNPRTAWPQAAQNALPGPLGFYPVALCLLAMIGGLCFAVIRLAGRVGLPGLALGGREEAPIARWAKPRDLAPLRVAGPQPGRVTLGRAHGSLLAAEERQSVIIFAPTQSYKTSGLLVPALLEWQGPVLATSVKHDLLADTLARRSAVGEVMVFDPAQVTNAPRSRATPLWGATSWRGAIRVAHWLAGGARTASAAGLQDADFWFASAEKLLAPLLFAAASSGRTIEAVVRWLDEGPEASDGTVTELLQEAGAPEAQRAWQANQNREERQRSSVYSTAEIAMAAFADPFVIEETSGADYTPAGLLDGGANTLYLCAPRKEQERLRPLFSMIVQELLAVVEEIAAVDEAPLDPPLLLLLDEAANIAPIPDLDELAASGAGQGVQLVTAFQDLAQVSVRFGRKASTIVNNHGAKIFGNGLSDREALEYASRLVGAGKFEQRSSTAGQKGHRSTTEGDQYRDLAPPNVIREADDGTGLLVYRGLPPAKIQLRPWYENAQLRELRQGPPSGSLTGEP
jgi:type IV secretion system protein VirD4